MSSDNNFSCLYEDVVPSVWIPPLDAVLGAIFLFVALLTVLINGFVIYVYLSCGRTLQGNSLILLQVAINDLISGIVGVVFCCNLLGGRSTSPFTSNVGDIILCQIYGVLLDIIYVTAPVLLALATTFRVIAVLWPYRFQQINQRYKYVQMLLCFVAWLFGMAVGLFPFFFGKWMCFSRISGSCDYFIINILEGNKHATRIYSLCLFVIPGNISYLVIVIGGGIVIVKLLKQYRKTIKRTDKSREKIKVNDHKQRRLSEYLKQRVEDARSAFRSRATHRASDSELRMIQKELNVIKCTLALCASYLVAHFITVAYNVVYIFKTDTKVFSTLAGGHMRGEVYILFWYYISHTVSGFVDGMVQVKCSTEMQRVLKHWKGRITGEPVTSTLDKGWNLVHSVQRFSLAGRAGSRGTIVVNAEATDFNAQGIPAASVPNGAPSAVPPPNGAPPVIVPPNGAVSSVAKAQGELPVITESFQSDVARNIDRMETPDVTSLEEAVQVSALTGKKNLPTITD